MTYTNDIYLDQCIINKRVGNRQFFVPYTPEGIRMLETMYANCIMAGVGTKEQLKKHIQENPHLHQTLKDDLILNLRHYGMAKVLCESDRKLLENKLAQRSLKFD